jgi:hypothetical protein
MFLESVFVSLMILTEIGRRVRVGYKKTTGYGFF